MNCLRVRRRDLADPEGVTRAWLESLPASTDVTWLAPACSENSRVGQRLKAAEESVRERARVVRHAPLFSDLLDHRRELKYQRTLTWPKGARPLPWVSPVGLEAYDSLAVGPESHTPATIAAGLSAALSRFLEPERFARARFAALDRHGRGYLDREELAEAYVELGSHPGEAERLAARSPSRLDFDEFYRDLEGLLERALAELTPRIETVELGRPGALHGLLKQGFTVEAAEATLELWDSLQADGLPVGPSHGPTLEVWAEKHALEWVAAHVLPAFGVLLGREGQLAGRPAFLSHLLTREGPDLISHRSADGQDVDMHWSGVEPSAHVRFEEGPRIRTLALSEGHLVGVSVRGYWRGLRHVPDLLWERRSVPAWQQALFAELGELQMEELTPRAPGDILCQCTGVTCGTVQTWIDEGCASVVELAERGRVTTVCGGCKPLVEELLGSDLLRGAEVCERTALGAGLTRLRFRPHHGECRPARPGQHILVQGRVGSRWITRAYTLSAPVDPEQGYEITVKREELGEFSRWLCDRASASALVRVSDPAGEFVCEGEGPVWFFAAGVGITPALAILRAAPVGPFHLHWSSPFPERFIFREELGKLATSLRLRATRSEGHLKPEDLPLPVPGGQVMMCGPRAFTENLKRMLSELGWPSEAVREELFGSQLDPQGKVEAPRRAVLKVGTVQPVEQESFDVQPGCDLEHEAEAFVRQCYEEQGLDALIAPRWEQVQASIRATGTYAHTYDELVFGVRLAWRNSNRCLGRDFWQRIEVRDQRHLETEAEMFAAILDHIEAGTNHGDLRATISIFRPDGRRILNPQLFRYAAYPQEDGSIVGDPLHVELTRTAQGLGWQPPSPCTRFDYLPLLIQLAGGQPRWFEIPRELILEVPLEHPEMPGFVRLGLKWYGLPAVSNMVLDLGGIRYTAAPFNGFYMGAEIGARNFGDVDRYNQLPEVARLLGLDCSRDRDLWKDRALVELNRAVLHSFEKHGVRLVDHHTLTRSFMQFAGKERACGRAVQADPQYLTPPLSACTTPTFGQLFDGNRKLKPGFFYPVD